MSTSKHDIFAFFFGIVFGGSFAMLTLYHLSFQEGRLFPMVRAQSKKNIQSTIAVTRRNDDLTVKMTPRALNLTVDRVDNLTASKLRDKVRVLCWIMTSPATLRTKAIHVRNTWSKRCNIRLFISSVGDKEFPAVGLPLKEGRDQLYEKTKAAFKYAWENYKDKADWFMKADDDTYVFVENLRFLLKDYDPEKPSYFGRKFKPVVKQGYMSGGAGYVLSREAVKRYVEAIESKKCAKGGGVEDVEMGMCMSVVGAVAEDSRDAAHRETFFPLTPEDHLIPQVIQDNHWLRTYNFYPTCAGRECCSNHPITFHYVSPNNMYIFDYFAYDVQVYGVSNFYGR